MNLKFLRSFSRGVGLILGICGIAAVVLCLIPPSPPAATGITTFQLTGVPLWLFLAAVFLRSAYLACFRWSPLVIRHVVGGVFFFITLLCIYFIPSRLPTGWGIVSLYLVLPVCYVIYRIVAKKVSRYAFPASSDAPPVSQEGNA
jgi:hypothetical protein